MSEPERQARPVDSRLQGRLAIYAAVLMAVVAGGFAVNFSLDSGEWSVGPVAVGWFLLCVWYWLYSVGFRYGRPLLKYFSLTAGLTFGGLLTAVCFDRASAQVAATADGAFRRGAVGALFWAGFVTAASAAAIAIHALVVGSGRATDESETHSQRNDSETHSQRNDSGTHSQRNDSETHSQRT